MPPPPPGANPPMAIKVWPKQNLWTPQMKDNYSGSIFTWAQQSKVLVARSNCESHCGSWFLKLEARTDSLWTVKTVTTWVNKPMAHVRPKLLIIRECRGDERRRKPLIIREWPLLGADGTRSLQVWAEIIFHLNLGGEQSDPGRGAKHATWTEVMTQSQQIATGEQVPPF